MENQAYDDLKVGIDDISFYFPKLYLPIRDLATQRNIEPDKLEFGLGLKNMAVPDVGEDAVTMASEAVIDLVRKNDLLPGTFNRIYVGTESMVDGSKPIASYILGILEKYYQSRNIDVMPLRRCDVVDMTFACIGATDALQNALDWIRVNPGEKAIIVASDWAKYDLESPGEYTQGAGAIAMLISRDPAILSIDKRWGVSTKCEHDFYKPIRRRVNNLDIVNSNGIDKSRLGKEVVSIHKETPVYDGPFSNQCYQSRITEAYHHFGEMTTSNQQLIDRWERLVLHLPYAYHARRVFSEVFMNYLKAKDQWEGFVQENELQTLMTENPEKNHKLLRAITKTPRYKNFVRSRIEKGERVSSQIGNVYTASVFISLLSTLAADIEENVDLTDSKIGLFAYGSGSKSKVFEGTVQEAYKERIERIAIFERLDDRQAISFDQYVYRHRGKLLAPMDSVDRIVFHQSSGWTETNAYARYYGLKEV